MLRKLIILFVASALLFSCKQSDLTVPATINDENNSSNSDFIFSGIAWNLKSDSLFSQGPGPNYFSKSSKNIWLDSLDYLHLKITNTNGKWECPELISKDEFGYGTYVFTIASNVATLNERVVLGLFTWDDTCFYKQANSEVDIEFSKWGNPSQTRTLTYTVQPYVWQNPIPYYERQNIPAVAVTGMIDSLSTHAFHWTDSLITFTSYKGDVFPGTTIIANWKFTKSNPKRRKILSNMQSFPIIIPAPDENTHARINLWLLGGLPPSDNNEVEVIIKSFKFIPN